MENCYEYKLFEQVFTDISIVIENLENLFTTRTFKIKIGTYYDIGHAMWAPDYLLTFTPNFTYNFMLTILCRIHF